MLCIYLYIFNNMYLFLHMCIYIYIKINIHTRLGGVDSPRAD